MSQIRQLVNEGSQAIQAGDLASLGQAMNQNQEQLRKLDASSPEIEQLCESALQAGALGAKLTGGGGGGCVIALAPQNEKKNPFCLATYWIFFISYFPWNPFFVY